MISCFGVVNGCSRLLDGVKVGKGEEMEGKEDEACEGRVRAELTVSTKCWRQS